MDGTVVVEVVRPQFLPGRRWLLESILVYSEEVLEALEILFYLSLVAVLAC